MVQKNTNARGAFLPRSTRGGQGVDQITPPGKDLTALNPTHFSSITQKTYFFIAPF
ncbi:unnamed protein product [Helicobacter mustelae 12198]|uniref:Uncharacterized protein n=1 Tax=Helicobacter mustelae (strain ATCC 43772 / CCUG 25715 / CIP 103759 / LMG 18044 / NCTC 12198 / R85-136P) TaxID=679897 RepID=D3UHL5_HELM1|nr:unnamed protein product [Helicobacter mustelae 12198]